jgi:hypothetical protein
MPEEDKILIERERIKEIINNKAQVLFNHRVSLRTRRYRRIVPLSEFKKFLENSLFKIDNPDYVRVRDRTPEN